MPFCWRTCLLILIPLFSQLAAAVDIVVHPGVNETHVSVDSARAIFGMRQPRWSDGSLIHVFVLADTHPTHVALCKETLNLFPYQLRLTWDRLVYSGLGQAPQVLGSEEEMLTRVAATPGAIGYVMKLNAREAVHALPVR